MNSSRNLLKSAGVLLYSLSKRIPRRLGRSAIGIAIERVLEQIGVLPIFLLLAVIFFGIFSHNFLTIPNLTNVARQSSYLALISIGQALTLIVGGFDLTVGVQVALTSIVSTKIMLMISNPATAIAVGIIVGVICGLLVGSSNGFFISFFKVSPFIVTLGMMGVVQGVILMVSHGTPVFGFTTMFSRILGYGSVWGIPVPLLITILIAVLVYIVISWTHLGIYFWAIGGDEEAARLSGIPVHRYKFYAYSLGGVFGGLTGVLLTARVASGEPLLGAPLVLESITAAVLGGVAVGGGVGNVPGVLLGALFMGLIANGMNLANIGSYAQQVLIGGLLLIAITTDRYLHRGY